MTRIFDDFSDIPTCSIHFHISKLPCTPSVTADSVQDQMEPQNDVANSSAHMSARRYSSALPWSLTYKNQIDSLVPSQSTLTAWMWPVAANSYFWS